MLISTNEHRPPRCIVTNPASPSTFEATVLVLGEHKVDCLATDQESDYFIAECSKRWPTATRAGEVL